MRLLIVRHGRMGQLVEDLAPEYGFEVAGILEIEPVEVDRQHRPRSASSSR